MSWRENPTGGPRLVRNGTGGVRRERKPAMKPIALFTLLFSLSADLSAHAGRATAATDRICLDVAHQPRFWGDPSAMPGMDVKKIERVN
jgi:hypothetical protein